MHNQTETKLLPCLLVLSGKNDKFFPYKSSPNSEKTIHTDFEVTSAIRCRILESFLQKYIVCISVYCRPCSQTIGSFFQHNETKLQHLHICYRCDRHCRAWKMSVVLLYKKKMTKFICKMVVLVSKCYWELEGVEEFQVEPVQEAKNNELAKGHFRKHFKEHTAKCVI